MSWFVKGFEKEFLDQSKRFYLKVWNSVENICILLNSLCLFFLTSDACVISEEMMKKHNIQLRWRKDKKLYSKTNDTVEFICKTGYCSKDSPAVFRTTCWEGKLEYPTCQERCRWSAVVKLKYVHVFRIFHYYSSSQFLFIKYCLTHLYS